MEVEDDGLGPIMFSYAFKKNLVMGSAKIMHKLLWEPYRGGMASQFLMVHLNAVTVDSLPNNLLFVP